MTEQTQQVDADGYPSIANKLMEKFVSQILVAVAGLGDDVISDRKKAPDHTFIQAVMGASEIEIDDDITHSIGSDSKAILHFKLGGSPTLFQEYLPTLLGERWSVDGSNVFVVLPESEDEEEVKRQVTQHRLIFRAVVESYDRSLRDAQDALVVLAKKAFRRRMAIQRAMATLKIPRKPHGDAR